MPRLTARDPFALRALVLVLLVATFFAAGGERIRRISRRLRLARAWSPVANYRVDAWVTPPPYTARPPVILPGLRTGDRRTPPGAAGLGAGWQRAGDPRDRQRASSISPATRRPHGGQSRGAPPPPTRHRGAPLHHRGPGQRHVARRRRRRRDLAVRRDSGPRAHHRAHQGPGAAGARRAEAGLQARGRLRRGRRQGDLRSASPRRTARPAAPALRPAGNRAGAAAGAHPQWRRPDHQGPHRASLGRRRRGDDADRARRGRQ